MYSEKRERDLIIGTELLMELCEQANQKKPSILLTHYSFDYFHRSEQEIVLKLLEEYNIQLWFAGHEHINLIRKQRDFFYEFQCGNLIYEGEETKPCVILGEYDTQSASGSIKLYAWFEPDGWGLYPFVNPNQKAQKRDIYEFMLQGQETKAIQFKDALKFPQERVLNDGTRIFNLYNLDTETLRTIPDEDFYIIKEQMGRRLNGRESREKIEEMFSNEVRMTLNSDKRYECMPMFQKVVRGVYNGFLYLDNNIAPLINIEIIHFFWEAMDVFVIKSDIFNGQILTENSNVMNIEWGYQLGIYSDVAERLMRFEKVQQFLASDCVYIKMIDHEKYNLKIDIAANSLWEKMRNDTEFWHGCMKKIAKIEAYHGVKFHLPEKATQDDYLVIDILSDSIDKKCCRKIPAIYMKNPGFHHSFSLEKVVILDNASGLPFLSLFGYTFKPISQYLLPGRFKWNRKTKSWESNVKEHCVELGVDFEICYEEDKNRELVE